ncbi:hypothetical protein [Nocardioides acrostichi]|uniref:Lipoprotein n=1 Tax=Nocardioides acrostichi TaxID=2784339 RepID=A0A930V042_9ACTN|nr:hypothetical protein [Nocardioides acrostichi]MBF4162220.1 hypothetical protein [Nocardioides acrostichi]
MDASLAARSSSALALAAVLGLGLAACGDETTGTATDETTASSSATTSPSPTESTSDAPVSTEAQVVKKVSATFGPDQLSVTLDVPGLDPASGRFVVVYSWQKRDVHVTMQTQDGADGPEIIGGFQDLNVESSGPIKASDLDADWDTDAGTVTLTLSSHLEGGKNAAAYVTAYGIKRTAHTLTEPKQSGAVVKTIARR